MRSLHSDTGYVLYRLGLRAGQLFNATLQESGLRLRHYALMRYLSTVPGALQRELSVHLGYDPSAIVSLVDDLERQDLAVRQPDPSDRRNRVVVLTEAGSAFLRDSDAAARRVTDELLDPLEQQERRTLHHLLLRIAAPKPGAPDGGR
ncbi:MarR family winged helix-turn-helix transcriptional regulator [Streptomyces sp. 4N509B]|uniref:MarR family winged helix-turn-helix transcriptional regulator n=1 Tax=Streptomyces sp. 4N509B TaxID=3457413 RepID=UPI003FD69F29